ncbi:MULTISPECIES: peptidoglycan DD-metalloendopeptidase family protein [unclassified Uliginosibacterium]|uniref:peptidoglycan DD-metalloendopeptidase family protein n=1 Tax=unclassified Uliginosibacterium TaxID=2621521 RepID=UPI0020B15626|nr:MULTISPECIES: peptidoglycan DD-metalloendopeptidase family protein [unclassified Uliginosibacterium]MDO6385956.1 peptidoglycan DD-metalloendopeptidase family protein [Uliginosibacterium sp. 31-12]
MQYDSCLCWPELNEVERMLKYKVLPLAGLILALAACSSNAPAPVEVRAPARPQEGPAVAKPGHYIVKKGDTLYSIANLHKRDYRELAAWNNLTDPNLIEVGQELRVAPQADVLAAKPVAPASSIESRPVPPPAVIGSTVASSASSSLPPASVSTPAATGELKTEPKGGRIAYTPQAWKDLTQPADKAPVTSASAPAAQSAPVESKAPVVADDGSWSWPVSGKVIGSFNESSNKGVDLDGKLGDPVLAAGTGEVKYVGSSLRGYGNLVIIKHNNDFSSVYAHNQEILVKEGQQVKKGQKIATLGKSDADRPKLHFEIRRQGKPVDPLKLLPTR